MKILFIILVFFSIISNVSASIKENIIKKFTDIKNVSFDFEQNINGKIENGNCIIEYPKKIYCLYDNFNKKLLVSNGKDLVIKNQQIDQYYIYPIEKTALNLILDKDFLISKIDKANMDLVDNKLYRFRFEENEHTINIFFDRKTLNLIGWQNIDIYQNLSITYLSSIIKNRKIKKGIFKLPERNN